MSERAHPLSPGEELLPPGEAEDIEELIAIFRAIQEQKDKQHRPVPRDVHPKQHGCVRAEFVVESALPETLRHGVLQASRTYAAVVRFSNSKQRDDRLPDGHGMAIKLVGVEGEKLLAADGAATTQDFVLIDHPVFFARGVADLVPLARDFQRLMLGGPVQKAGTVLIAMLSSDRRFRLLRQAGAKRPDNPLEVQYWSTTPYKLGEGAMKFSLRPQLDTAPQPPIKSADKLRLAMAAQLREREARFDFLVQLQTDPVTMPIEDATVRWDEAASPFRKVATLIIPRQIFDSPAQHAFGQNLSFSPWHGLLEHRPLGGINRARRMAYEVMSAERLAASGVAKREPTLEDVRAVFPLDS
jgi:hypothetical protein